VTTVRKKHPENTW